MVFGLFPKDFDHVEFRTVRWQVAEEGVERCHPAQGETVIQAVVNACVIEDDESRDRLGDLGNQAFHEFDEGFALDRGSGLSVIQALSGEIQCPHHSNPLMMRRRHRLRAAHGRPGALNGRRGREPRLVVIEQLAAAVACPSLQTGQCFGAGGKLFRVAVFFRFIRVRLKLNPDCLRIAPSRSSDSGKGAP